MAITSKGCPPKPPVKQQVNTIKDALDSMGASAKCKSNFQHATDAYEKASSGTSAGGGEGEGFLTFALSHKSSNETDNKLRESLQKDGCGDIFANINSQIQAQEAMLCEISNKSSKQSISVNENASITINAKPWSEAARKTNLGALGPKPASVAVAIAGARTEFQAKMIEKSHEEDLKAWQTAYNQAVGETILKNSTFKLEVGSQIQQINSTSNVSKTQLLNHFKAAATAAAVSKVQSKSGLGSTPQQLKKIVANNLNSKNTEITNSINNSLTSTHIQASTGGNIELLVTGYANLDNLYFDEHIQSRMIAQNIAQNATNLGNTIASNILSKASTSSDTKQDSSGEEALLKQIYAGQVKMAAQANKSPLGGLFSGAALMFLLPAIIFIAVIFFAPHLVEDFLPGPLKYVAVGVLAYFILAYFIGFWPFGRSEKRYIPDLPFYEFADLGYKEVPYKNFNYKL
tara:strand:- start:3625 stop:5004 length:1380 start_codon:yes stop_codon:yes gene_type:complete